MGMNGEGGLAQNSTCTVHTPLQELKQARAEARKTMTKKARRAARKAAAATADDDWVSTTAGARKKKAGGGAQASTADGGGAVNKENLMETMAWKERNAFLTRRAWHTQESQDDGVLSEVQSIDVDSVESSQE
eukprot:SAG22_NODE_14_length_33165_cov_13.196698_30_plen_133_part_00